MKIKRLAVIAGAAGILPLVAAIPAHAEPLFIAGTAHVQDAGWLARVGENATIGTTGRSLRLEAIRLDGTELTVRPHVQNLGWLDRVPAGEVAGTTGRGLRLEAVKVRSEVPGWGIECRAHVQDLGWMDWVGDDQICGTVGQAKRLEAIQLRIISRTTDN